MVRTLETKDDFDAIMKEAGEKAVIIDFTAQWCGPCKKIGPKFVEFAEAHATIVAAKVDVDENAETAESEGISAMPTFRVYKNGTKVDELCGASEEKLKELFSKYS